MLIFVNDNNLNSFFAEVAKIGEHSFRTCQQEIVHQAAWSLSGFFFLKQRRTLYAYEHLRDIMLA